MAEQTPEIRHQPTTIQPSNSNIGHTATGTNWGTAADTYAVMRHGPDGKLFLDPHFLTHLLHTVSGDTVIDIGCGAGHWAIEVANAGASRVEALDISANFVAIAEKAVQNSNLAGRVNVQQGDAAKLEFGNSSFVRAMSINVGCNLPHNGFAEHFSEMYRVLKPGGIAIVTAPANLDVVFTNGTMDNVASDQAISEALNELGFDSKPADVIAKLGTLSHILRATFYRAHDGSVALYDSSMTGILRPGQEIWRKLPAQAVPNRYHAEAEYVSQAQDAGFQILHDIRDSFRDAETHKRYVTHFPECGLGEEYVQNPFIVLVLKKPAD